MLCKSFLAPLMQYFTAVVLLLFIALVPITCALQASGCRLMLFADTQLIACLVVHNEAATCKAQCIAASHV